MTLFSIHGSFLWISLGVICRAQDRYIGGQECQTACKPGSVRASRCCHRPALNDHSSATRIAARLTRPTRAAGRECPWMHVAVPPAAPIRSCSRWGLPCRPCHQARGALLPPRFTLTLPPMFSHARSGGLFSVALSLGSPPPAVSRHRIPVEPGLSSAVPLTRDRQRSSSRLADGLWRALPRAAREAGPFARFSLRQVPASILSSDWARARVAASASPWTWSGSQWRWKAVISVLESISGS